MNKTTTAAFKRYGTNLRIYDNGGESFDRYTIIPARYDLKHRCGLYFKFFDCIAASDEPFHPQGFGQWTTAAPGPHLGKRVPLSALPADVVKFARQSFPEYFAPQLTKLEQT